MCVMCEMMRSIGKEHGQFDVEGKLYKQLEVKMVVDGYTSPITAGNFVDLVRRGFYNGMHIQRSDGFVVQTGEPHSRDHRRGHGRYHSRDMETVKEIIAEIIAESYIEKVNEIVAETSQDHRM